MDTRPIPHKELITEALAACLEELKAGKNLDEVLRPYGKLGDDLRPLLETALHNQAYAASLTAPRAAQLRSRAQFLNAAQAFSEKKPRPWWAGIAMPRLAMAAFIFLAVIILGGFTTAAASAQSLPGDILYPFKLASERTRLWLTRSPGERLALEETFDDLRAQEILELMQSNRNESVRLAGEVTSMQSNEWLVRDIRVRLNADTVLEQEIEVGFYVEVTGWLQNDGSVQAQSIRTRQIEFSGTVDQVEADMLVIDGLPVTVTGRTVWLGYPVAGSQVTVKAFVLADGSLQAFQVELAGASRAAATWTATIPPTQTSTATQPPTQTPAPSATARPGDDDDNENENGNTNDNENNNDDGSDDDSNDNDDSDDDNDNDNSGSGSSDDNSNDDDDDDDDDDD
jgi:hypothetical protein